MHRDESLKDRSDRPLLEPRELTDARTMRALAHPVRLALLEALTLEGPLTATEAGERIDESPTTCSFHLRQLARYGFVEEAGGGRGRARPWRLARLGVRFTSVHDNPELGLAAAALDRVFREHFLSRLQTWSETRQSYPEDWQESAGSHEFLLYVTSAELAALSGQVDALFAHLKERLVDPSKRPEGALPVEVLVFSYPIRSTPSGG
jgi:DNA-binding transcriptional ArsR family regulator